MSAPLWDVVAAHTYDFLSAEYRALYDHSTATVFQSPLWLDRLYRRVAVELNAEPLVLLIRERATERLAAALPLIVRRRFGLQVVEFADFGVSDYCSPVCDPDLLSTLLGDESIQLRLRELMTSCDLIMIQKVREETLPLFELLGQTHRSALSFGAHAAELSGPYDVWRKTNIPSSQRRVLEKKRRRLAKLGTLATSVTTSAQDFQQVLENIPRFRDDRFRAIGAVDILTKETFARFYREAANEAPPARAYLMKLDGSIVAAAFGLSHNKTLHFILSGFDFVNFRNASLGILLIEDVIEDCIARGETSLDLSIGDQAYKRDFHTHETAMWSIWSGISLRGRLVAFVLPRSQRLRQLARRVLRR